MKDRPILFSDSMVRAILEGRKTQTRRVVKSVPCSCGDWLPEEVCATTAEGWQTGGHSGRWWCGSCGVCDDGVNCPYGAPRERLWVREAWGLVNDGGWAVEPSTLRWRADNACRLVSVDELKSTPPADGCSAIPRVLPRPGWRPSIHMPRWASRILLEVTDVRVGRLQEIAPADVIAEGVQYPVNAENGHPLLQLTGDKHLPGEYLSKQNRDWMRMDGAAGGEFDEADWLRAHFAALWDNINGTGSWEANPWVWVVTFRRLT